MHKTPCPAGTDPARPAAHVEAASPVDSATSSPLGIRRIDYTVVFVRDMPAMRRFYEHIIGFRIKRELGPDWVEYDAGGGTTLALTSPGLMFGDAAPAKGTLMLQLAFRVEPVQLDRAVARLESLGVGGIDGPTDQAWGHRTVFLRDPDGNVIEFFADLAPGT